jgi:hypothetical protein
MEIEQDKKGQKNQKVSKARKRKNRRQKKNAKPHAGADASDMPLDNRENDDEEILEFSRTVNVVTTRERKRLDPEIFSRLQNWSIVQSRQAASVK